MVKHGQQKVKMRYLWAALLSSLSLAGGYAFVFSGISFSLVTGWLANSLDEQLAGKLQFEEIRFSTSQGLCLERLKIRHSVKNLQVELSAPVGCLQHLWYTAGSWFSTIHLHLDEPTVRIEPIRAVTKSPIRQASIAGSTSTPAISNLDLSFQGLILHWKNMERVSPWITSFGRSPPLRGSIQLSGEQELSVLNFLLSASNEIPQLEGKWEVGSNTWVLMLDIEGDLVDALPYVNLNSSLWKQKSPSPGVPTPSIKRSVKKTTGSSQAQNISIGRLPVDGVVLIEGVPNTPLFRVNINMRQEGVDLHYPLFTRDPLEGVELQTQLEATINPELQTVDIAQTRLVVNQVPVDIKLSIDDFGDKKPQLATNLSFPAVPLKTILNAVPPAEGTQLAQTVDPSITFSATISTKGELFSPETWEPEINYSFRQPKGNTGLEVFDSSFLFFPLTSTGRSQIGAVLGPGTANWLSYNQIPTLVRKSIITAEDSTFLSHKGIELFEIRDALLSRLKGGRIRGGSTITQQLVKNLFLSRDRTLLRKAQEVLIAFYLEYLKNKQDIFELYVNIVEWGPRIFGLQAASQHYFAVDVEDLTSAEVAFLAILIPAPTKYHQYHQSGRTPPFLRRKVDRLLERLNRFGHLSDEDLNAAIASPIQLAPHID